MLSLYPALFGAFAVLALFGANFEELAPTEATRLLLLTVAAGCLVTAACQLLWQDRQRGGLVAAGTLIAFFSYGHLYVALGEIEFGGGSLGHHRYALAVAGVLWLAWVLWTGRWLRRTAALSQFLQGVAAAVVLLSAWSLAWRGAAARAPLAPAFQPAGQSGTPGQAEALPDIYYIVLDGYGRQDILARYYELDNSAFLTGLRDLGFYIAEHSTANYNQTVLSLAASLNMQYAQDMLESPSDGAEARARLALALKHSRVRQWLSERGYELLAFETGYSQTEIRDAEAFWGPESDTSVAEHPLIGGRITPFESLFLSTTAVRILLDFDPLRQQLLVSAVIDPHYQQHRDRVRYTLNSLGKAAERPGPTFVFAHMISPHPPFVFTADGGTAANAGIYSLADADAFGGTPDEYVARYRAQLQYLNTLVLPALQELLRRAERPAIVLLQADHGPGAYLVWDSLEDTLLEERLSILNAYYFPDGDFSALDPAISPVNSFRVVLTQYLGASLPRLPDRAFFSTWDEPLTLVEVTDQIR